MAILRTALIGSGLDGRNDARVISGADTAVLDWVVDVDLSRAQRLTHEFGGHPTSDLESVKTCDIAVVASSTATHPEVTDYLIGESIPTLVEKPLATTLGDVERLVQAADERDVPLVCGFVERFNSAVTTTHQLLDGPLRHLVVVRHSPPNVRPTSSVVDDLLIHDIDLAIGFAGSGVAAVKSAVSPVENPFDDGIVDASIVFENSVLAMLTASRLSQRKIRNLMLTTESSLYELDLLRSDVSVYQHRAHEIAEEGTPSPTGRRPRWTSRSCGAAASPSHFSSSTSSNWWTERGTRLPNVARSFRRTSWRPPRLRVPEAAPGIERAQCPPRTNRHRDERPRIRLRRLAQSGEPGRSAAAARDGL